MELIGIKEIMAMTGKGRYTVTKWLNDPTCPVFPRTKNEPFVIDRKAFENWYVGRCMDKKRKVRS